MRGASSRTTSRSSARRAPSRPRRPPRPTASSSRFYPSQAATLDATYATWLANNGLTGDAGIAVGRGGRRQAATSRRWTRTRRCRPSPGERTPASGGPTESFLGGPPAGPPPSFAPMGFAAAWRTFHPFALTGPGPLSARRRRPQLTSDRYTADYNEVKAKGALTGSTRTPEQTDIAYFWPDNLSCMLDRGLAQSSHSACRTSGNRARLFALANMAVADALITCWDSKRTTTSGARSRRSGKGERRQPERRRRSGLAAVHQHADLSGLHVGRQQRDGPSMRTLELFFGRDDIAVASRAMRRLPSRRRARTRASRPCRSRS